jgi:hypothetical protein
MSALVDQFSQHPACFATCISNTSGDNQGFRSTHCLAECYAMLCSLPLPRRISTEKARQLVNESVLGRPQLRSIEGIPPI